MTRRPSICRRGATVPVIFRRPLGTFVFFGLSANVSIVPASSPKSCALIREILRGVFVPPKGICGGVFVCRGLFVLRFLAVCSSGCSQNIAIKIVPVLTCVRSTAVGPKNNKFTKAQHCSVLSIHGLISTKITASRRIHRPSTRWNLNL